MSVKNILKSSKVASLALILSNCTQTNLPIESKYEFPQGTIVQNMQNCEDNSRELLFIRQLHGIGANANHSELIQARKEKRTPLIDKIQIVQTDIYSIIGNLYNQSLRDFAIEGLTSKPEDNLSYYTSKAYTQIPISENMKDELLTKSVTLSRSWNKANSYEREKIGREIDKLGDESNEYINSFLKEYTFLPGATPYFATQVDDLNLIPAEDDILNSQLFFLLDYKDILLETYFQACPIENETCQEYKSTINLLTEITRPIMFEKRETAALDRINDQSNSTVVLVYGGAHNFEAAAKRWNSLNQDQVPFCVTTITPQSYNTFQ